MTVALVVLGVLAAWAVVATATAVIVVRCIRINENACTRPGDRMSDEQVRAEFNRIVDSTR